MYSKQDIQDKVTETMNIVLEPVSYYKMDAMEIVGVYEKRLQRIAEKCGNLKAMIELLERE